MASYPDVVNHVKGVIPFQWACEQKIIKTEFGDGTESRRLIWQSARRNVSIQYKFLSLYDTHIIYDFYRKRNGPYELFSFFFPQTKTYTKEYCGTSDGTEIGINLPSLIDDEIIPMNYYLYAGDSLISPSLYTLVNNGGPDGEDYLYLNGGFHFNAGVKYYWTFTGRLKTKVRFDDSPIEIDEVKDQYASFTINLIGLKAELI